MARSGAPLPSFRDVEFRTFSAKRRGRDSLLYLQRGRHDQPHCPRSRLRIRPDRKLGESSRISRVERPLARWHRSQDQSSNGVLRSLPGHGRLAAEGRSGVARRGEHQSSRCPERPLRNIDLLSIDIDGSDYWIWEALEHVQPRVVVLEYLDILGAERAWSVPYRRDFVGQHDEMGLCYGGASLPAFVKLGRRKAIVSWGASSMIQRILLANDVAPDVFPEVSVESCLVHPRWSRESNRVSSALSTRTGSKFNQSRA